MTRISGAVLGGRYQLHSPIGIGGMAKVYLARDRILNRDVAVKVLHEDTASDPRFVERFRREAHAAAALNHPNIVSIYDWREEEGETQAVYFMVMEYVPGNNLKELIEERGPLPEAEALDIARQVAQALGAAHVRGVIHRDVKPHNILIGPRGQAKVADFGIARAAGASQLTKTNMLCGTAQYLSPEQAQRRPIDGRSDIYSLGIVLYEMLTGAEPFTGDSPIEVAMQHINETPRSPRQLRPEVHPATEAVVMKALAKDPDQRYQSADDLRMALERARRLVAERDEATTPALAVRAAQAEPVARHGAARIPATATPSPTRERMVRRPLRDERSRSWHRWLLAVPLLALLAVVAGVFAMSHQGSRTALGPPIATPKTAHHRFPGAHRPASHPSATTTVRRHASGRKHHSASRPPAVVAQQPTSTPIPPTSTPEPAPARAPIAPTPTATTPAPISVAAAGSGATGPVQAVQAFYQLVSQHDFADARDLWSPTMQASLNPQVYIDNRFTRTRQISAPTADLVSESTDRATVAVTVVEISSEGTERTYSGSWQLVKIGSGWYLNWPNLHQS